MQIVIYHLYLTIYHLWKFIIATSQTPLILQIVIYISYLTIYHLWQFIIVTSQKRLILQIVHRLPQCFNLLVRFEPDFGNSTVLAVLQSKCSTKTRRRWKTGENKTALIAQLAKSEVWRKTVENRGWPLKIDAWTVI